MPVGYHTSGLWSNSTWNPLCSAGHRDDTAIHGREDAPGLGNGGAGGLGLVKYRWPSPPAVGIEPAWVSVRRQGILGPDGQIRQVDVVGLHCCCSGLLDLHLNAGWPPHSGHAGPAGGRMHVGDDRHPTLGLGLGDLEIVLQRLHAGLQLSPGGTELLDLVLLAGQGGSRGRSLLPVGVQLLLKRRDLPHQLLNLRPLRRPSATCCLPHDLLLFQLRVLPQPCDGLFLRGHFGL
mmetsp:Transcript_63119/g.169256  ORF Transcript_63119/g.169256 Transcript_63119/m.169256 type:complete len:234 (-) Transcript_63119:640-1341(-)